MMSRGLSEVELLAPANDGNRPVQYLSQWDGVTRQAPVVNYLQSTLGGMDPVRGSQFGTQAARGLPEAAINEFGGFALAKVLGVGAQIFSGVARSETSLLNAELKATVNNALAREMPLGAPLEGFAGVGHAGSLREPGAVFNLLYGARVGEGLPGAAGVAIPSRPTPTELANLTAKHDVEFAVTYKYGAGPNGGGGQYYLYSGAKGEVQVPIYADEMFIYHTHPGGTAWASKEDMDVLNSLRLVGSPQRSSQIVPVGKDVVRFGSKR